MVMVVGVNVIVELAVCFVLLVTGVTIIRLPEVSCRFSHVLFPFKIVLQTAQSTQKNKTLTGPGFSESSSYLGESSCELLPLQGGNLAFHFQEDQEDKYIAAGAQKHLGQKEVATFKSHETLVSKRLYKAHCDWQCM